MVLLNIFCRLGKLLTSIIFLSFLLGFYSCDSPKKNNENAKDKIQEEYLFNSVPSSESGIDFVNTLEETLESNYFQYMYTYNGGGVAAGDINNDGLIDLYFTSNAAPDKLYLNKGNFKFEDITAKAGLANKEGFEFGVTMADVNNDGFLDIYVSRGGWKDEDNKFANLLYINNGDLTFTEKGKELGLDDSGRTINATFFDYDKDNDLDVYVSNTPDVTGRTQVYNLDSLQRNPKTLALKGSDKLYNNDGTGHFTDVSKKAGLVYDIGYGLNPQVGDLNDDGWPDIYVSSDFNIPDMAYLNNGDGTFTEGRDKLLKHMSFSTMGSDMADINNDGLMDLMTLDMNPEDYVRAKTTMAMISIRGFEKMVANGYHHQYMHNMLQLNNGNGTFSEISKMAGMADTDWSWSILSADFDLDGYNDIYITNGVYRDVIDQDTNDKMAKILMENGRKPTAEDFLKFVKMLPQQKLHNYFFRNNGDLTFDDTSASWADTPPTFSNGSIYADLDNDGDLDVVVNNINDSATVLRNNAVQMDKGRFLQVQFSGPDKNKFGLGAIVKIHMSNGELLTRQLINTRGFLSSVSNKLHFGLGTTASISKLQVIWPDGKEQEFTKVAPDTLLKVSYTDATDSKGDELILPSPNPIFTKLASNYDHKDPYFNDYDLQYLLPHKLSQTGPGVAKGDVNGDGLEDVFLGGGHQQAGQLLLGGTNGKFKSVEVAAFDKDRSQEDVGAVFFDADNDNDLDLYVVSGSYEFYRNPILLQDRLYINNGKGQFTRAKDQLPNMETAGSVVVPCDFDKDGDMDLFVGGRVIPAKYPYPATSYLLVNNKGSFSIATPSLAPELEKIGMVTNAVWTDVNNDSALDLIVTGEWMGIQVFLNEDNKLVKSDAYPELANSKGWWNRLLVADVDGDGDQDIVAGNLGLNYKFHASKENPFDVYTSDFDFNGIEDIILAKNYKGREVPVRGRTCMTQQLPHLIGKIPTYNDFASRDLEGILGKKMESALHYQATEFRSGIFVNDGKGSYAFRPFGNAVQKSPINAILFDDFDGDGNKDLLLAGNNYQSEIETTRADAGIGVFLQGNGKGDFKPETNLQSGFFADKDVRNMIMVKDAKEKLIFVINNNNKHDLFKVNKPGKPLYATSK